MFYPLYISKRKTGQFGLFSIQSNPKKELQDSFIPDVDNWIKNIEFDSNVAAEIQKKLYLLGVRHETIFPDLGGFTFDLKVKFNVTSCHIEKKLVMVNNKHSW